MLVDNRADEGTEGAGQQAPVPHKEIELMPNRLNQPIKLKRPSMPARKRGAASETPVATADESTTKTPTKARLSQPIKIERLDVFVDKSYLMFPRSKCGQQGQGCHRQVGPLSQ